MGVDPSSGKTFQVSIKIHDQLQTILDKGQIKYQIICLWNLSCTIDKHCIKWYQLNIIMETQQNQILGLIIYHFLMMETYAKILECLGRGLG